MIEKPFSIELYVHYAAFECRICFMYVARMPSSELEHLIDAVGGRGFAEDLCRVHRTTMGRWLAGTIKPPAAALATLRAAAWGQMPGRDRAWDGWFFRDGLLWSPEGERFDAGEIRALVYMRKVISAQREQIVTLEQRLVAATREASRLDPAANDNAIWPDDVRSKAYEQKSPGEPGQASAK